VVQFLSPSWAEEFNAALDGVELPGPGPEAGLAAADGRFAVVQEVHGGPDGDVSVVLRVDGGSLRFRVEAGGERRTTDAGTAGQGPADVTIVISYEDAAALSKGEMAPAEALNAGRIRVRGDLSVLVAAQGMLVAARAATQALAASTTY
jgi:putative sterol carrier protein